MIDHSIDALLSLHGSVIDQEDGYRLTTSIERRLIKGCHTVLAAHTNC